MNEQNPDTRLEACGARYDITPEELQASTEAFLSTHPPKGDERFACYRIYGWQDAANIGRSIESTVFMEKFRNTAEDLQKAYGPYESASEFLVTFDTHAKAAVGALRIIKPNKEVGLMTLNDMASGTLRRPRLGTKVQLSIEEAMRAHGVDDLEDCWDVGTVAVLPEYRAIRNAESMASIQLYRALYLLAHTHGVKHFVSMIDTTPLKKMKHILGIPFTRLGKTPVVKYLDSAKTQGVYGYVPEFYGKMDRHRNRKFGPGRLAKPLLARLMDGKYGMDESMQFPFVEESTVALNALRPPRRLNTLENPPLLKADTVPDQSSLAA
jgi:hypothetical protein